MSEKMAGSSPLLTDSQRKLFKSALGSGEVPKTITSPQRQAIRDICKGMCDQASRPEQLLVAFKGLLSQAANEAKIPLGVERNTLVDLLVSVFIQELYIADAAGRKNGEDDSHGKTAEPFSPARTPGLRDARL
jgi:hypothetical protein